MPRVSNSQNKTAFKRQGSGKGITTDISNGIGQSAEVVDIILDPGHPAWSPTKFPERKIGDILARPLLEFNKTTDQLQWYHPLFPNFFAGYPLIGEILLLVEGSGASTTKSHTGKNLYYLPAINVWQDPNNNQLPASSFNINLLSTTPSEAEHCNPSGQYSANAGEEEPVDLTPALGRTFQDMPILKLQPYEGDVIFEGRNGQSLRFGSTFKTGLSPNFWSAGGANGDPITIISTGHRPGTKDKNESDIPIVNHIEDPNQDAAIMFMCNGNSVDMETASDNWDSYEVTYESQIDAERKEKGYTPTPAPEPYKPKPAEEAPNEELPPVKEEEPCPPCPDGSIPVKNTEGDCGQCKEELEQAKARKESSVAEENRTKDHTCGLDRKLSKSLCMEIVQKTIAGGGSKKFSDIGWMKKSTRYGKGGFKSGGGECWVGILHWTGRATATLYEGMDKEGMVEKYWPNKVTIPSKNPSKGWYYDGQYEGKTVQITVGILKDFAKHADYKELNYPWWADAMQSFCANARDARKAQRRGVWEKFGSKVQDISDKAVAAGFPPYQTAREYAMVMFHMNSYGAPLHSDTFFKDQDSWGTKLNWDSEELLKVYCGGLVKGKNKSSGNQSDRQQISCCRSRCNMLHTEYPPCKCTLDPNNIHYKPFIYGGCNGPRRSSIDGSGGTGESNWQGKKCIVDNYTGSGVGKTAPLPDGSPGECADPNFDKGLDGWKCMTQEDFCTWANAFFRNVNRSFGFQQSLSSEDKELLTDRTRACE